MDALRQIKVVEFTSVGAGASAGKLLAEYGAECVLVEPPEGCLQRSTSAFDWYSAGKRSAVLNLKTARGRELMRRLVREADVFLAGYRPYVLRQFGLDAASLMGENPRLIYASITGYGGEGREKPGHDATSFWARGGLLDLMTPEGAKPPLPPTGMSGIACGVTLCMGVCLALLERERTGRGREVSTSMLQNALYFGAGTAAGRPAAPAGGPGGPPENLLPLPGRPVGPAL